MFLLPTTVVFEKLLGFNIVDSMESVAGVSARTLKNFRKGKHAPRPGTIKKICDNIDRLAACNNPDCRLEFEKTFEEASRTENILGWSLWLDAFNAGIHPRVFLPRTQDLLRRLESGTLEFWAKYEADGHESAVRFLASTDLPRRILSQERIEHIKGTRDFESLCRVLAPITIEILPYVVASLDAEYTVAYDVESERRSRFAPFLPVKRGDSVMLPIPRFLRWAQDKKGFSRKSEMVRKLDDCVDMENEDENDKPPSMERQLTRWLKGEVAPRWSSLDRFVRYMFPDLDFDFVDIRFSMAPIVLFHRVYEMLEEMTKGAICAGTVEDVLELFGQYEGWFSEFLERYSSGNEGR